MKPSGNGGRPQTEINVTGAIPAGLSWSLGRPATLRDGGNGKEMTGPDQGWDDRASRVVEFAICGDVDPDFSLSVDDIPNALRPDKRASELRPGFDTGGHYEIEVEGNIIDFSPEPVGWQVSMLNPPSEAWAREVAQEILQRMSRVSGQTGRVHEL